MGKTKRAEVNHRERSDKGSRIKDKHKKWSQGRVVGDQEFELYLLRTHGLQIHLMRGDGNCLFRSIAHQLHRDPDQHHYAIRSRVVNYMEQRKDFYSLFIEDDMTWDEYIDGMKTSGTWGGYQELCAASSAFNLSIHVYQWNEPKYVIQPAEMSPNDAESDGPRRVIMLSFHDGCHYNSLRPADASLMAQESSSKSTAASTTTALPPKKEAQQKKKTGGATNREVLIHSISLAVSWVNRDEILAALNWADDDEDDAIELLCSHLHSLRAMIAATEHAESKAEGAGEVKVDGRSADCDGVPTTSPSASASTDVEASSHPTIASQTQAPPAVTASGRPLSKKELRQREKQERENAKKKPHLVNKVIVAAVKKINSSGKSQSSANSSHGEGPVDAAGSDSVVDLSDKMREIVV